MKRWEKLYPDRKRVTADGHVYYELTKAEILEVTSPPAWRRWLLIGSPFLGVVAAQLIYHLLVK